MIIIREYTTNQYRFECSLCTAVINIPVKDITPEKKVEILVTHLEGHNNKDLAVSISAGLLESIGEVFD